MFRVDSRRKDTFPSLLQNLTRSMMGKDEGEVAEGGGGRTRNWRSAKVANTSITVATLKEKKQDHATTCLGFV